MIYGDGVSVKYSTIVEGRRAELYAGLSLQAQEEKLPQLTAFIHEIKHSTPAEFEQWYELYVGTVSHIPQRRKKET